MWERQRGGELRSPALLQCWCVVSLQRLRCMTGSRVHKEARLQAAFFVAAQLDCACSAGSDAAVVVVLSAVRRRR